MQCSSHIFFRGQNADGPVQACICIRLDQTTITIIFTVRHSIRVYPFPTSVDPRVVTALVPSDALIRRAPASSCRFDPRCLAPIRNHLSGTPACSLSNVKYPGDRRMSLMRVLILHGCKEGWHTAVTQRCAEAWVQRLIRWTRYNARSDPSNFLRVRRCLFCCNTRSHMRRRRHVRMRPDSDHNGHVVDRPEASDIERTIDARRAKRTFNRRLVLG